jgi:hypothetical protein
MTRDRSVYCVKKIYNKKVEEKITKDPKAANTPSQGNS